MDTVECRELIVTTLTRRGNGTEDSPFRVITEVFEKDGTKIAEHDPIQYAEYTSGQLLDFAQHVIAARIRPENLKDALNDWEAIPGSRPLFEKTSKPA